MRPKRQSVMTGREVVLDVLERLEHGLGVCAAEFLVGLFPELQAAFGGEFVDGGFVEPVVEVDDEVDALWDDVFGRNGIC